MLLAGLPPLVRVNVRGSNAAYVARGLVRYALAEARSPRPGGAGVLAKLSEVLFIEVLRLYMNEQARAARAGWPAWATASSARRSNALHKSRRMPGRSRSSRARAARRARCSPERFQQLVGSSPMQYLTQWRMLLAPTC
jgi:hypothetical protein